ncbi:MAG: hypothetical protein LUE27_09085 [Clostridia bacterium]|nr:hypothetical protein [Clostridia bacterium]
MHTYNEFTLFLARENLGEALEYAVNACGLDPDEFMTLFINSGFASLFEGRDCVSVSYRSGTENAMEILRRMKGMTEFPPALDGEIKAVYWAGSILVYYQWETGRPYRDILICISMKDIIGMYDSFHEAPESKFVDIMEAIIARKDGSGK